MDLAGIILEYCKVLLSTPVIAGLLILLFKMILLKLPVKGKSIYNGVARFRINTHLRENGLITALAVI